MTTTQFFGVNVEVALRRGDRWLLIERGRNLTNAPGLLAFPGGRVEADSVRDSILEETARRELAEELGLDLPAVELRYARSNFFIGDDTHHYIGVTLTAALPDIFEPRIASAEEVEALHWLTVDEMQVHPKCPEWTIASVFGVCRHGASTDGVD